MNRSSVYIIHLKECIPKIFLIKRREDWRIKSGQKWYYDFFEALILTNFWVVLYWTRKIKSSNSWPLRQLGGEHGWHVYVCLYMCVPVHVYVCLCMCVCACLCMCVHVHACLCVCTCAYTHCFFSHLPVWRWNIIIHFRSVAVMRTWSNSIIPAPHKLVRDSRLPTLCVNICLTCIWPMQNQKD